MLPRLGRLPTLASRLGQPPYSRRLKAAPRTDQGIGDRCRLCGVIRYYYSADLRAVDLLVSLGLSATPQIFPFVPTPTVYILWQPAFHG